MDEEQMSSSNDYHVIVLGARAPAKHRAGALAVCGLALPSWSESWSPGV
jgi:hypothetical protein